MTSENSRVQEAKDVIARQRDELRNILEQARRDGNFESARERLARWKERTTRALQENVQSVEAEKFAAKRKGSFIMGQPLRNLDDEVRMYDAFLQTLLEEITRFPEHTVRPAVVIPAEPATVEVPQPSTSNAVFVVHGHDELNLLRLKELLRDRWALDPIVLSGEPGKGRTIIEKFEEEAQRAVFALALFTPDDLVSSRDSEYAQPRPNALFELGWFYGRLGRDRVCILFKKGTKIHTDLDGISRIEFQESVMEKLDEIERELSGARILPR